MARPLTLEQARKICSDLQSLRGYALPNGFDTWKIQYVFVWPSDSAGIDMAILYVQQSGIWPTPIPVSDSGYDVFCMHYTGSKVYTALARKVIEAYGLKYKFPESYSVN